MKHFLEFLAVYSIIAFLHMMPLSFVLKFGSFIGLFAYYIIPVRRSVALTNLKIAFPEKSDRERKMICRDSYKNFGMTFFEFLCLNTLSHEKIKRMVTFDPPDLMSETMALNKGVIVITGHFGSFELAGVSVSNAGNPLVVLVKAMRNPMVESIMDKLRKETGIGVIKTKDGISPIIRSIRDGKLVAFVADQDGGVNGVNVDFFNTESSTPAGPALFALRTGAPSIGVYIIREGIAKYTAKFHLISYDGLPDNKDDKVREMIQRYTSLLESYIRQYPGQYFWMHKRWKSKGVYN